MSTAELALEAREIRGPSALGGGTRRFFDLLWTIATTDFKVSYFGSVLGYLWTLMRPLLLFGVLYLVFSEVLKFGAGIERYPVLLLLNIVLFAFFAEATQACVPAVVNRESLVRKMHFPRLVIPLATVLTAAFNLCLNLVAVTIFLLIYGIDPTWTWLLLPAVVAALVVLAAGVGTLLSVLYVRYRDVEPIWSVTSTMLFYATPVLYPIESVPDDYWGLALVNPVAALLELARVWVIDSSAPGLTAASGYELGWLPPLAIMLGVCVLAFWLFNREAPRIAEEL
jgi:ABC-2 type transport system permease protein